MPVIDDDLDALNGAEELTWHQAETLMREDEPQDAYKAALREGFKQTYRIFQRGMERVANHSHPLFALDCFMLSMGMWSTGAVNGEEKFTVAAVEIARKHAVTRQAATHLVSWFRDSVADRPITGMPGQRPMAGRHHMKQARERQLVK